MTDKSTNDIESYAHCVKCLDEKPDDVTPQEWARINVGATPKGIQAWCVRHDCNIVAYDFLGQKVAYDVDPPSPVMEQELRVVLYELKEGGFVRLCGYAPNGDEIWQITEKGRKVAAEES